MRHRIILADNAVDRMLWWDVGTEKVYWESYLGTFIREATVDELLAHADNIQNYADWLQNHKPYGITA